MPQLIVKTRDGVEHPVDGQAGASVMEVIRAAGFEELVAICGGSCSCATCHVYVSSGFADRLPTASAMERDLLEFSDHYQQTSRLSCQLAFNETLDGLEVTIAPED